MKTAKGHCVYLRIDKIYLSCFIGSSLVIFFFKSMITSLNLSGKPECSDVLLVAIGIDVKILSIIAGQLLKLRKPTTDVDSISLPR